MSWTVGKRRVRRVLEPDAIFGRLCDAARDVGLTFHLIGIIDSYGAVDCRLFVNQMPDEGHEDIWPGVCHKRWRLSSGEMRPRSLCGTSDPDLEECDTILRLSIQKVLTAALRALELPAVNQPAPYL